MHGDEEMAGWYRREVADDARVLMLIKLGQADLAAAHFITTEHRVRNETDELPDAMAGMRERLEAVDLWPTLDALLGPLITQRARKNRARAKAAEDNAKTRDVTGQDGTSRDVTARQHNTTQHERETLSDKTPEPPPVATEPKAEKPSRKAPAVRIPATWAPNDAHRVTAKDRRLNVDWQAERFRDHAETNDRRCANWDAAFRNWLAKADPSREPRAPIGPRPTAATLTTVGIPEFRRVTP